MRTQEQKDRRKKYDSARRDMMTPAERKKYNAKQRESYRRRKTKLTEEQRLLRNERERIRKANRTEAQKEKQREYERKHRLNETSLQREQRQLYQRLYHRIKRQCKQWTDAEREKLRNYKRNKNLLPELQRKNSNTPIDIARNDVRIVQLKYGIY